MAMLMILFLVSCGSSDDDPRPETPSTGLNIVETAVADGRFTTLVAALQAAELDDDLSGAGPFTVFAPTDDAFSALPDGTLDTLLDPANQEILINILTYHVYAGTAGSDDVVAKNGTSFFMLNGSYLRVDVVDGDVILNNGRDSAARVILTDIESTNGVIHVVDTVLLPDDEYMDIVATANADSRFSTLVTALVAAELDDDLEGEGPFTVFAPTNNAFAALPVGTLDTLLDPANRSLLIDILTYHVYGGSVFAADAIALDGSSVTMLNGKEMTISVVNGNVVINANGIGEAMVILTDVVAANGVIHVIDAVLDPNDAP